MMYLGEEWPVSEAMAAINKTLDEAEEFVRNLEMRMLTDYAENDEQLN